MTEITKDQIRDFYDKEGLVPTSRQENVYSKPTSMARMTAVKKMMDKHVDGRFLEIGCAEGMYCSYASSKADIVVGLDISKPKIKRSIPGENILYMVGDWDNLPFADKSFDVALATECIEHSLNPSLVVSELFRVARRIIVTVPIKEPKLEDPMHHRTGHIQAFREDSFKELFSEHSILEEHVDNDVGFIALVVKE